MEMYINVNANANVHVNDNVNLDANANVMYVFVYIYIYILQSPSNGCTPYLPLSMMFLSQPARKFLVTVTEALQAQVKARQGPSDC